MTDPFRPGAHGVGASFLYRPPTGAVSLFPAMRRSLARSAFSPSPHGPSLPYRPRDRLRYPGSCRALRKLRFRQEPGRLRLRAPPIHNPPAAPLVASFHIRTYPRGTLGRTRTEGGTRCAPSVQWPAMTDYAMISTGYTAPLSKASPHAEAGRVSRFTNLSDATQFRSHTVVSTLTERGRERLFRW